MVDTALVNSLKMGGVHNLLRQMEGEWEGPVSTWFQPGPPSDESIWRGSIQRVLGDRFLLHTYEGSMQGKALEGSMLIGVHLKTRKAQMAWIDSFHNGTAMMLCEGEPIENGISVLGSYGEETGQRWGWRTTIVLESDLSLRITMTNIPPEGQGEPAKAVEVLYLRKV
jgi:hypothetical protein